MKRLESFLDTYSWLLKLGIWVLLIFWAAQLSCIFTFKDAREQQPRNMALEKELTQKLYVLNETQLKRAKDMGPFYGPEDYFNDFKEIKLLQHKISKDSGYEPYLSGTALMQLQCLSMNNIGKGKNFSYEDTSRAAESFKNWLNSGGAVGDDFHAQVDKMSGKEVWLIVLAWFSGLYLKGIFLVSMLFVVRMAQRKGILKTILADKIRFVYSIILWPVFLSKYPHNVIREIVVEAELRRIGKLFRRFTPGERNLVRQIAENKNFWKWIGNFHLSNKLVFERSFAFALIATILLHVFTPITAQAALGHRDLTRAGPEIVSVESASDSTLDNQQLHNHSGELALFETSLRLCTGLPTIIRFHLRTFQMKDFFRMIEHVPLNGCLFFTGMIFYPEK